MVESGGEEGNPYFYHVPGFDNSFGPKKEQQ
jgi:hypothetical protein